MAIDFLKVHDAAGEHAGDPQRRQAPWFPVHKPAAGGPVLCTIRDPNIQAVTKQLLGKLLPQWADLSPAFNQAENGMQVWATPLSRRAAGTDARQGADFALNLISQQFDQFKK